MFPFKRVHALPCVGSDRAMTFRDNGGVIDPFAVPGQQLQYMACPGCVPHPTTASFHFTPFITLTNQTHVPPFCSLFMQLLRQHLKYL
jgi:hypothetical protein